MFDRALIIILAILKLKTCQNKFWSRICVLFRKYLIMVCVISTYAEYFQKRSESTYYLYIILLLMFKLWTYEYYANKA